MRTTLRIMALTFTASLLNVSMISAAPRRKGPVAGAIDKPHLVGIASWYGSQHQGRKMANGQKFDRHKLTAAYWYLPLGSVIRVTNLENGKSINVTVTDRGPNFRLHRILDLSEAAARELDYIQNGLTQVFVFPVISYEPEHAELPQVLVDLQDEILSTSTIQEDVF